MGSQQELQLQHTYQNLPPPNDSLLTSPHQANPLYQISNDQSYQEVGVPQLYNSLRRKYQGNTPTPFRPTERVVVPNLKAKHPSAVKNYSSQQQPFNYIS